MHNSVFIDITNEIEPDDSNDPDGAQQVKYCDLAGFLNSLGIDRARRGVVARAFQAGSIGKSPLRSTFIDGVVGTFWFASPAVDAGVCNHNGHGALVSIGEIALAKITAYPLRMLATSLQFLQEMSSMLTETPKVDVERARKLLLDLPKSRSHRDPRAGAIDTQEQEP